MPLVFYSKQQSFYKPQFQIYISILNATLYNCFFLMLTNVKQKMDACILLVTNEIRRIQSFASYPALSEKIQRKASGSKDFIHFNILLSSKT
jgi:hypothetical protein